MSVIAELRSLPVVERIQLVEYLWDSIAEDSAGFRLTDLQRGEVEPCLDNFKMLPTAGVPGEQVSSALQSEP